MRAVIYQANCFYRRRFSAHRRWFSSHYASPVVDGVPGALYFRHFLGVDEQRVFLQRCQKLNRILQEEASRALEQQPLEDTKVPQPKFVKSAAHNLASDERFVRLEVEDPSQANARTAGAPLNCEYFPEYGEDGHALAYFRNNPNIPLFVQNLLLPRLVREVSPVAQLMQEKNSDELMNWKMTFNTYSLKPGTKTLAGFPFHTDLASNGNVTMIATLMNKATLQIVHKDHSDVNEELENNGPSSSSSSSPSPPSSSDLVNGAHHPAVINLTLEPGSLLVLSGESRWDWRHRVVPTKVDPQGDDEAVADTGVNRISLVLGCQ